VPSQDLYDFDEDDDEDPPRSEGLRFKAQALFTKIKEKLRKLQPKDKKDINFDVEDEDDQKEDT
jgi:hypothetical protein